MAQHVKLAVLSNDVAVDTETLVYNRVTNRWDPAESRTDEFAADIAELKSRSGTSGADIPASPDIVTKTVTNLVVNPAPSSIDGWLAIGTAGSMVFDTGALVSTSPINTSGGMQTGIRSAGGSTYRMTVTPGTKYTISVEVASSTFAGGISLGALVGLAGGTTTLLTDPTGISSPSTPTRYSWTFTAPTEAASVIVYLGNRGSVATGQTLRARRFMVTTDAAAPYGVGTFTYETSGNGLTGTIADNLIDLKAKAATVDSLSGTVTNLQATVGTLDSEVGTLDSRVAAIESGGATTTTWVPTPAKPATTFTAATNSRYGSRMDYLHNYGRLWTKNSPGLRWSDDEGATWQLARTFDKNIHGTLQLDNGEMLVTTASAVTTELNDVWLSTGLLAGPASATWTKVLTSLYPRVHVHADWGMSTWRNYVLLSEYGADGATDGAHRVYLSTDHGKTYTTILNLGGTTGLHVHGSAIDPYHVTPAGPRLWVVNGDGVHTGTRWSDDLGRTWATLPQPTQMVGILPMPNAVLFTSDGPLDGIYASRRTGGPIPEPAKLVYRVGTSGNMSHLGTAHQAPARTGAPAIIPFAATDTVGVGRIVLTRDGLTFHEVFTDTVALGVGQGVQAAYGPLPSGKIGGLLSSGSRVGTPQGDLRFTAPTWTAVTS